MFARINHMAVISPNYPFLGKFYEAVFGLKTQNKRPADALVFGDGYVGFNIIPKRDGYIGGLDHFGMEVDDIGLALSRMKAKHPKADIVQRPSARPYAAYSGHDPDGNVFDLAQKKEDTRKDIYASIATEGGWNQDRTFNKFAIRTPNAEQVADFYMDVFELEPSNKQTSVPGFHLTDGRVTLSILPWSIPLFEGISIKRPGPDHLGFKVENIEAFKADVQKVAGMNPYLAPVPLGGSPESEVRKQFFAKSATGKFQMTDPDGTWIDVTDE